MIGFGTETERHPNLLGRRFRWVLAVMIPMFGLLISRLWYLQIYRGDEYLDLTWRNVLHTEILAPFRGRILDRHGRSLADNRPTFKLMAEAERVTEAHVRDLGAALSLLPADVDAACARLIAFRSKNRRGTFDLMVDVPLEVAALVKQETHRFPGLSVRDQPYRHYPEGQLAAHVVGYMNQISASELERLSDRGYETTEKIGRVGVERLQEQQLRGARGIEKYVANARGQRVDDGHADSLIGSDRVRPPRPGNDVYLSLDLSLQRQAEKLLATRSAGAIAVVDVHSGRVLAMASSPSFVPDEMSGRLSRERDDELRNDPRKPYVNKVTAQHYPPGSVFKVVAAVAALEAGVMAAAQTQYCDGSHRSGRQHKRCTGIHQHVSLETALAVSCNVYFWKVAEDVGLDRIAAVARDFGFGEKTGIPLRGEAAGLVPTRSWYQERNDLKPGHALNAAVGQGDVLVTVMQLVMAYAAIANGGTLYEPLLIERIATAEGATVQTREPRIRRTVSVSPQTLQVIRSGLEKTVAHPEGTAYTYARTDVVDIAGKTGTAQVRDGLDSAEPSLENWNPRADHAWFAGYAPADAPEVAFVVLVEHGGFGGAQAGPIVRKLMEHHFSSREDLR